MTRRSTRSPNHGVWWRIAVLGLLLAACGPAAAPVVVPSASAPASIGSIPSTDSSTAASASPATPSTEPGTVVALVAGGYNNCVLTSAGGVKCWGENGAGGLGDGTTTNRSTPVDVLGLEPGVTAIAAGNGHTCGITAGGGLLCWGYSNHGQLGDGEATDSAKPVEVEGLGSGVTAVGAGLVHTCAVATGGVTKCWGLNAAGQLGNADPAGSSIPVDVEGVAGTLTLIDGGGDHTCGLAGGGGVTCWGYNQDGELGDGTTTQSSLPVDTIDLGGTVTAVSAGDNGTCALTAAGGVRCWGDNALGQLGNGSTSNSSVPVDVTGLASGATAVSYGGRHACAVTGAGAVSCWGSNASGQLGDGSITDALTAVGATELGDGVLAVAAGGEHTCALSDDGVVKCWGDNEFGQLGNGTTTDSPTPVEVDFSGAPAVEPSTEPTLGPQAVVQAFYDWYLTEHEYADVFTRSELTPEFVQFVKDFDGGYDAILCAQDTPDGVSATTEDISGSSATVETSVAFGGSGGPGPTVTLTLGPAGWQISAIGCAF